MTIGKAIRSLRNARDLTQRELAAKMQVDASYVSFLEKDKRDPTFSTLRSVAAALDAPLYLLVLLATKDEPATGTGAQIKRELGGQLFDLFLAVDSKS